MASVNRARAATSVQIHGPALRALRSRARMPLSRLARAAGCSVSFLAQIERGVKRATTQRVYDALVAELGLRDPRALLVNPYSGDVTDATVSEWVQTGPTVVPYPCGGSKTHPTTPDRAA